MKEISYVRLFQTNVNLSGGINLPPLIFIFKSEISMKRKRKCIARGKKSVWCDGCHTNSTKCPLRDKYRDFRHTKYEKRRWKYDYNGKF